MFCCCCWGRDASAKASKFFFKVSIDDTYIFNTVYVSNAPFEVDCLACSIFFTPDYR